MTEPGETDDYSVLEHVLTIERHLGAQLFDYVIYNTSPVPDALAASYATVGAKPIITGDFELNALTRLGIQPIGVPLVSEHPAGKIRHHPDRLAAAITALGQGKLGAWRNWPEAGSYLNVRTLLSAAGTSLRAQSGSRLPLSEPRPSRGPRLPALRAREPGRVRGDHGEIGSGKTTLLQTLLRGLDSQTTVGRIVNTLLEPRELIETIMIDFGLEASNRSKPTMLRDLAQYLVDQRLAGAVVLLVIDEAQNLSVAALEELRMLSNLETEKSKLLQIALVGQPNLRDTLSSPQLEQLRQRITVSYHLLPLDPAKRPTTSTTGSGARRSARRWSSRGTPPTSFTPAAAAFPGRSMSSATRPSSSGTPKSGGRWICR